MIFLTLITCCVSFIFFYTTLSVKPLPPWVHGFRLVSLWLLRDDPLPLFSMFGRKTGNVQKVEGNPEVTVTLLDLPELVLECILEKLPPDGLCKMATVCTSMRDRCTSDHLWEKHMNKKWGGVVGPIARRKWQVYSSDSILSKQGNQSRNSSSFMRLLAHLCPLLRNRSRSSPCCSIRKKKKDHRLDSIMSWYLALESGKFWFPAQVYNRENGHVGFLLSCYDAELSYDQGTDTFRARYLPHGWKPSAIETAVIWERVRASPVDTSPHDLHINGCLTELQPGDHVEIQWRRNKEFPYGWWYGVMGHLESCNGSAIRCRCGDNDSLVLEFRHYSSGSRWRRAAVHRREHREVGNEADGFYGGIRKLCSDQEIAAWKLFWPSQVLV